MHDRSVMQILQALDELVKVGSAELLSQGSLLEHFEQIVAGQVLQHESKPFVLLAVSLDVEIREAGVDVVYEVRMVQCLEDADFLQKELLVLAEDVRRQVVAEELDGVFLAVLFGEFDLPKGALTEGAQNGIGAILCSSFSLHSN